MSHHGITHNHTVCRVTSVFTAVQFELSVSGRGVALGAQRTVYLHVFSVFAVRWALGATLVKSYRESRLSKCGEVLEVSEVFRNTKLKLSRAVLVFFYLFRLFIIIMTLQHIVRNKSLLSSAVPHFPPLLRHVQQLWTDRTQTSLVTEGSQLLNYRMRVLLVTGE